MKTKNTNTVFLPTVAECAATLTEAQARLKKATEAKAKAEKDTSPALHLPAASLAAGLAKGENRRAGFLRIAGEVVAAVPGFTKPEQVSTEAGRVVSSLGSLAGFTAGQDGGNNSFAGKGKAKFGQGLTLRDIAGQLADSGHKTLAALAKAAGLAVAYQRADSAAASVAKAEKALTEAKAREAGQTEAGTYESRAETREEAEAEAKANPGKTPRKSAPWGGALAGSPGYEMAKDEAADRKKAAKVKKNAAAVDA